MEESKNQQWVFVGLGNPGKKYEMTRHNIGYIVIKALAERLGLTLREEKRFKAQHAKGVIDNTTVHLLLPTTYMNDSGVAVRRMLDFFKLSSSNIVVIVDDADLPFGKLRLRELGSSGGHNGLKSIEQHMGTRSYPRLRIGIGRHERQGSLTGHVLNQFSKNEINALPELINRSHESLLRLAQDELDQVMNQVNASEKPKFRPSKEGQESK